LAFVVRNGSLTVVARSPAEVLRTVEKFIGDDAASEPVISTFDGVMIDIEALRRLAADPDDG
jgi:hypothetical protein